MPTKTPTLERILFEADFPRSAFWRVETDGWQHSQGPNGFRPSYYQGMNDGFEFVCQNFSKKLTPAMLEEMHKLACQNEPEFINLCYGYLFMTERETGSVPTNGITRDYITSLIKKTQDPDTLAAIADLEGFRTNACEFGLSLALTSLDGLNPAIAAKFNAEAAISEAGLDDFIDALIKAYKTGDNTSPMTPLWYVEFSSTYESAEIDPNKMDRSAIRRILIKNFSSNKKFLLGTDFSAEDENERVTVKVFSPGLSKEAQKKAAQSAIDTYYKNIELIPKGMTETTDNIIIEIIKLVRHLHQNHPFNDGNGRTFVFLVMNYLLMQQGLGMAFTQFPAHFTGYSNKELLNEINKGLDQYAQYKITKGKEFLSNISEKRVSTELNEVTKGLAACLDKDPLIAMDQLNELYLQIQSHQLKVPAGYQPSRYFAITIFGGNLKEHYAHQKIIGMIKELYLEKANTHLAGLTTSSDPVKYGGNFIPKGMALTNNKKIFQDIISKHDILGDPSLKAALDKKSDAHFEKSAAKEPGAHPGS